MGFQGLTKLKNLNLGGTRITSLPSGYYNSIGIGGFEYGRCSKLTSLPENIGDLSQWNNLI